MPTGSKIAAIVLVVLLAAAGLYYAFVAPPASNNTTALGSKNSSTPTNGNGNLPGGAAGLASQTPNTLTPSGFANGTATGTPTGTPTITLVPTGTGTLASSNTGSAGGPAPINSGNSTGVNTNSGTNQPGFAPGTLGSAGTGKGDFATPGLNGSNGALPAGALSNNGTTGTRPGTTTLNGGTFGGNATGGNNGFAPTTPTGTTARAGNTAGSTVGNTVGNTGGSALAGGNVTGGPAPVGARSIGTGSNPGTGSMPVTTAPTTERTHVIVSGDSFSSISTKYFGTESKAAAIASANPLVDPTRMKIGAKLRIPESTTLVAAPTVVTPNGKSSNGNTVAASTSGNNHNVASGETLAAISRKYYGSTKYWQKLYAANKGTIGSDPAALKVGQKLTIPAKTVVVGAENVER